jgi:hypothetical protein
MKKTLVNWDGRPAVLFTDPEYKAVAMLEPNGTWTEVDAGDVFDSGSVIASEEIFKARFQPQFGDFKVPATAAKA